MKPTERLNIDLQRLVREFARREIIPKAPRIDAGEAKARTILKEIAELGFANVRIPETLGGLGLNTVDACIIAEELAFGCSGISSAIEASELAITPLLVFGTPDQQARLLPPLLAKPSFAGLQALEWRSEQSGITAMPCQDGFLLNGTMHGIVNASCADWLFVEATMARSDETIGDQGELAYFCLPADVSGIELVDCPVLVGRKAADLASVTCHSVKITSNLRLSIKGGRKLLSEVLSRYNFPIIAATCVGVAQAALESACAYAKGRQAFGKAIAEHQAVSFMLADMVRAVEVARILAFTAAAASDSNYFCPSICLSAKSYAQEVVMKVTTSAVQVLGGYGYTSEYAVSKLMRDAKLCQLMYGTSESIKSEMGWALIAEATERS